MRVLKDQMDEGAKIKTGQDDVVNLWLVRWAAMNVSRFLVGKDGRTAYERRRGRQCKVPLALFGGNVWYKQLAEGKAKVDKFESEWREGIWLGHSRKSNETLVGTESGVVRAYAIRRQDEGSRWGGKMIQSLKGTPQQPDPNKPGTSVPIRISFDEAPDRGQAIPAAPVRREDVPRRVKITEAMLRKYGYTEGCQGCSFRRAGLSEQRAHSEACRTRIEGLLDRETEGSKNWERAKRRQDSFIADQIEKEDKEEAKKRRRVEESAEPENVAEAAEEVEEARAEKRKGEVAEDEAENEEDQRQAKRHRTFETGTVAALRKLSVDIAEIYSPPRVTVEGEKWRLRPGEAMDLTTGWDFRNAEDRNRLGST